MLCFLLRKKINKKCWFNFGLLREKEWILRCLLQHTSILPCLYLLKFLMHWCVSTSQWDAFNFSWEAGKKRTCMLSELKLCICCFGVFFDARLKIQSDTISKQIKGMQSYFQTGKATLKNCINFPCLILLQVYLGAWVFRIWKQKLPIVPDLCLWLLSLWQS